MPQPIPSRAAKLAAGAAGTLLTAAYLDKQYGFYQDIKRLLEDRKFSKELNQRLGQLGDNVTIYHMLELADPKQSALWFEGRSWTYAELKIEVDRLASILQQHGISQGAVVALFTTNSPEMVFSIYALAKLGAIPAYVNTALRSATLGHCMKVADPRLIICTPDLAGCLVDLFKETNAPLPCFSLNLLSFAPLSLPAGPHTQDIVQIRYEDLATVQDPVSYSSPKVYLKDTGCLIFTSGTSGKPKAVSVKNFLPVIVSTPVPKDTNNRKRYFPLRTFSCLPLFHATGLFTGVYYCVGTSGTFCLARKFSASNYMKQLVESRATRMLYVGELCRFLISSKPTPYDQAHSCLVATGNGLQRDVWIRFKRRFNIPEVREMYRSTEGLAKFDNGTNLHGGEGAVAFAGPIRRRFEKDTYLVKYDVATESPYRDTATGFCVPAALGEPGEAIGRVRSMDIYSDYRNNPEANNAKLIRDVFEKGDIFQRTGDLLIHEKDGWIRFQDRSGDTYRWKGENVSAGEVGEHIGRLPEVQDVSVYGVKLDAYDGQPGAAYITLSSPSHEPHFIATLYHRLRATGLTTWQIPRLIRITTNITTNATFKHAKEALKSRSWDPEHPQNSSVPPSSSSDATSTATARPDGLYYLNVETGRYEVLDHRIWGDIKEGRARL